MTRRHAVTVRHELVGAFRAAGVHAIRLDVTPRWRLVRRARARRGLTRALASALGGARS